MLKTCYNNNTMVVLGGQPKLNSQKQLTLTLYKEEICLQLILLSSTLTFTPEASQRKMELCVQCVS